jgi:hypothetical protein
MNALIEILRRGGCYWPRPPKAPGRALAVPSGARFRIALPPNQPEVHERPSGGPDERMVGRARKALKRALLKGQKPAPDGARTDAAAAPPPVYAGGVCRDGLFVLDEGVVANGAKAIRVFDTGEAAARAAGAAGDAFACVEFLVGEQWLSAAALSRPDALPWAEADELAIDIAAAAIADKLKADGETLSRAAMIRKAADAVAAFSYFTEEARERLKWK